MSTRKKKKFQNDEWENFRKHCLVCYFQSRRQLTSSHWGWDIASLSDVVCSPSYLVMIHYTEILCPCIIIVNYVWSSRWGSWKKGRIILQEQCMSFLVSFLSSLFVTVPNSITFCMYRYDCMQIRSILHFKGNWGMTNHM